MNRRLAKMMLGLVVTVGLAAGTSSLWAQPVKLPEVAVTATRSERPLNKVPQNVTVITSDEIERLSPLTVTDLLRSVPGLMVRDFTGTGALASVDMRGFGESAAQHTLVLVDGQRLNQIDLSGVDFTTIPVENIERIEILHGPAGVLYGDSAIGGVINIITRKGTGAPSGRVQASYGSYNLWGTRGYFQGAKGPFGWFVSARTDSTDGYRTNSETRLRNATFTTTYEASGGLSLLVQGALGRSNYSLPGSLTQQQYDTDPTASTRNNEWGSKTQKILRTRLTKDFGAPGVLTIDLAYRRQDAEAHLWGTAYDTKIDTITLMPKHLWVAALGGHTNRLTVGVDLFYVDMSSDRSYIGGAKYRTTDYRVTMVGPYFLNELELTKRLTLSVGARYQSADYQIDNKPVGSASSSYSPSDDQWAMSVGLTFNPTPASKLYARISRSFRYPTVEEYVTWGVFNPNLNPEKCWAYEVGGSYSFASGGRVSLAAYLMKLKDEIAYNPQTYLNENLEDTEHKGLEASVVVPVGKKLSLLGSLTWEQARFTAGTYDGNDLPLVPEWKASVGATAEPIKGLVATVRVNYVGERPYGNDKANTYGKLKDYTTVDISLTYTYKRWHLFLNATNIFSEKYADYAYASAWGKSYYPAPEAMVWGGIAVSF